MAASDAQVRVEDNPQAQQFEAHVGQYLAVAEYERHGSTIIFTHTEVPEPIEGHGIASQLARTALEQARAEGLIVIPRCPYIAAYIRRHPEYAALVPPAYRDRERGNG
jgi:predicted GNAT family acetyltransferase